MSFFLDHIRQIVAGYTGNPPLAVYLKAYFKRHPKLGSRDRKALTEAAFIYYRCRRFFPGDPSGAEVIAQGISWCSSPNVFLKKMIAQEPLAIVEPEKRLMATALLWENISAGLPARKWLQSLWQQPQLYIRIRKNKAHCLQLLQQHGITFEEIQMPGAKEMNCLKIENGAAVDRVLPEDAYVVQDLSSQSSIYQLLDVLPGMPAQVWDVCSGAGGKSILLKDQLPPFSLLATDVRESILHNLKMRFRKYDLGKADTMVLNSADAGALKQALHSRLFDLVLCDVPCSGSGTWARTPEQFHFFKAEDLAKFEALQFPIAFNAQQYVQPGGIFAYVTCSVFQQENEAVVQRLLEHTSLSLVHQQLIDGIGLQADCMFVAFFRK